MKYIRTKDGRIKKLNKENEKFFEGKKIFLASTLEEVKQADTIEELCDEFVLIANDSDVPRYRFKTFQEAIDKLKALDYLGEGLILKGAIWTDKGLIFVAVMNEKGELELL